MSLERGPDHSLVVLSRHIVRLDHARIELKLPAAVQDRWLVVGTAGVALFGLIFVGTWGLVASAVIGALFALLHLLWGRVRLRFDARELTFRWGLGLRVRVPLSQITGLECRPGIGLRLHRGTDQPVDMFLPGLPPAELAAVEQLVRHALSQHVPDGDPNDIPPEMGPLLGR